MFSLNLKLIEVKKMKKIFAIIMTFCICLSGCVSTEPEVDPNLVTMEVTYSDPEKISYEITNNWKFGIEFGSEYEIEYLEGTEWIPVAERTEAFFTLIAHGIASGEKNVFSADFEGRYGALSSGKYRVVKDIKLLNEDGTECGSQRVYAEFEITAVER